MEVIVFVRTRLRKIGVYAGTVSVRILGKLKRVMFEFMLTEHHTSKQRFLVRKRDKSQRRAKSIFLNHQGQLSASSFPTSGAAFFKLVRKGLGKTISRLEKQFGSKSQRETLRSDCRYQCTVSWTERNIISALVY
jgi:thiamine kinase-like enzyme